MPTYEVAQYKVNSPYVYLDDKGYGVLPGKHCLYLPEQEAKIVLSFNGGIDSHAWMRGSKAEQINNFTFNEDHKGFSPESINSLKTEWAILKLLSEHGMTPPPSSFFFIKNFISDIFTSTMHCDPIGVYGYFVKNAEYLPAGSYSFDKFKYLFLDTKMITASPGAIGDLEKKEGNLVNGYLVDVRRSLHDMMQVNVDVPVPFHEWKITAESLKSRILQGTQFPYRERQQNYQSYYLDGEYIDGTRKTLYRFDKMGIEKDLSGKSVLDLGSQLGSMAFEAYMRGARKVTGLEYEVDYLTCARDLARYNGFQVNFMKMDLMNPNKCIEYLNNYYPEGIDIVFALSLVKHIGCKNNFEILNGIKWKTCYLESHNTGTTGLDTPLVREMVYYMEKSRWKYKHLGFTEDRSPRAIFQAWR